MGNLNKPTKHFKSVKRENGITLVALIITIIILVIISAVTIKEVTDMNLVNLAIKAGEAYSGSQENELGKLGDIHNSLDNMGSGDKPKPEIAIESVTLTAQGTPNGSIAKVLASVQPENARS